MFCETSTVSIGTWHMADANVFRARAATCTCKTPTQQVALHVKSAMQVQFLCHIAARCQQSDEPKKRTDQGPRPTLALVQVLDHVLADVAPGCLQGLPVGVAVALALLVQRLVAASPA